MEASWLSLLPPLVVLIAACITKRLHASLILGVLTAALLACSGSPLQSGMLIKQRFVEYVTDSDTLYLGLFLITIGCLIMLIAGSGGVSAFTKSMKKKLSDKTSAESYSLFLSMVFSIDDYLSSITVGHIMQPIADKFKIARTKLAYLIHSLSGPLVILIPISSWAAVITSNLDSSGISISSESTTKINADPFYVYLNSIPFIFYSIFTIFCVYYIVKRKISFGTMKTYEDTYNANTPENGSPEESSTKASLFDILFPFTTLLATVIVGILYTGEYHLFGGNNSLINALKNNSENSLVLFIASIVSFLLTLLSTVIRKKARLTQIPGIIKKGVLLMGPPIIMLILANTLGNILRYDLHTGDYLAQALTGSLSVSFLPLMLFVISTITALLTGTSWATMALLLPIAIPMITSLSGAITPSTISDLPVIFPALGALFSGAVCGDHLSPISETTIMASTGAGTKPITHFYTQLPYALPAILASVVSFMISGLLISQPIVTNLFISLTTGIALCLIILTIAGDAKK